FNARQLKDIHRQLTKLNTDEPPFADEVPAQGTITWVKPALVADVEFTERTATGALRHPVFRGLRDDKDPHEVIMHQETLMNSTHPQRPSPSSSPARPAKRGVARGPSVAGVQLTHADRILYPEQGLTKLDLAHYYEDIQDWILPHLANRPLALLRCPEGWEHECFFQKHPGSAFAKDIPRLQIKEKRGGRAEFVYVSDVRDLVALVQLGVLELHPWGSKIDDVEAPDTLIFDLDPGPDLPWRNIAQAASGLHERLQALGLNGFLQATGGKGLHLVVPIEPTLSWDDAKAFAHAVCRLHAQDDPTAFTTNMAKHKRHGKVFLDYLRNGRGSTSVARYSPRARANAPVATPLRWNELTPTTGANRYTVNTVRRRLNALKADPWTGYEAARRQISSRLQQDLQKQAGLN
ncbi:MAG: DNA ligase D, partial [Natronospirillum sp.]